MPSPSPLPIGIIGVGKYLPSRKVTNLELCQKLGIPSGWIEERTGIQSRYFASEKETVSFMSLEASRQALRKTAIQPEDIDSVILCTSSSEFRFPATACWLQNQLGAIHAGAFDLSQGAAGFVRGICLAADRLITSSERDYILVVGASMLSPYLNWRDPNTSVLFGDGAGAVVVSRVPDGYGILSSTSLSRGESFGALRLNRNGSPWIEMDGMRVSREFLKYQPIIIQQTLEKVNLDIEEVNFFIFHQANRRLMDALVSKMRIPPSKTYTNVERFGNTADASIALLLSEVVEKGLLQQDDWVLVSAVGAGCVFEVFLMKWYQKN